MAGQQRRSGIDVDTKGFLAGLARAYAEMGLSSQRELVRLAIEVQNRARELCPVDTGRLRSSIGHTEGVDVRGPFVDVGTNVEYAPFVEYGTMHMAPQPFLRPALAEAVEGFGRGRAVA